MTEEVKLALNHGYKITKIYSIWHWDQIEQYNEETKTEGLFTEYKNTFLKILAILVGVKAKAINSNIFKIM